MITMNTMIAGPTCVQEQPKDFRVPMNTSDIKRRSVKFNPFIVFLSYCSKFSRRIYTSFWRQLKEQTDNIPPFTCIGSLLEIATPLSSGKSRSKRTIFVCSYAFRNASLHAPFSSGKSRSNRTIFVCPFLLAHRSA